MGKKMKLSGNPETWISQDQKRFEDFCESLGLTEDEINACIEDVLCAGGLCDCEMIFNLLSDYVGRARQI